MTVSIADLDGIQPRLRDLVPTLDATAATTLAGITASVTELNYLDDTVPGTAVAYAALALGANKNVDTLVIADGGLKLGATAGTAVGATAAEINIACDSSSFIGTYTATAPAAIPATVRVIELNHASTAIEKTIADLSVYAGKRLIVKDISATGTAAHTVTITTCLLYTSPSPRDS